MKMPPAIERGVRRQNVVFMHNRNQFSAEYFQFIKKLVSCNSSLLRLQNDKLVSVLDIRQNILNFKLFYLDRNIIHHNFTDPGLRRTVYVKCTVSLKISFSHWVSHEKVFERSRL